MDERPEPAFPAEPGSYLLHLVLARPLRLSVGRLGAFPFPAGSYFYSGSAHGPGGLRARLNHHLKLAARPHWHVDYLRAAAQVRGGWYITSPGSLECAWSQALLRRPDSVLAAPGFGAADCRNSCPSHLTVFPSPIDIGEIEALLQTTVATTGLVSFSVPLYL